MIIKQTTTLIFEYPQDYLQEQEWCKTKEDRWIHKGTDTLGAVYENTISYSIGQPSNSEIPNNCEHITEDGVTCAKYPACDDCLDNPLNKVKGSERLLKGKDEPKTQMKTQNSNLTFEKDECAKEYEELGLKELKALIEADRKDEPTCDTCRHKGVEGCEQPCLGCGCCGLYEAMTGNDKLKEKVVEFIKSCARCKHRPIGAMMCEESCRYEPKTEPQTEREGE